MHFFLEMVQLLNLFLKQWCYILLYCICRHVCVVFHLPHFTAPPVFPSQRFCSLNISPLMIFITHADCQYMHSRSLVFSAALFTQQCGFFLVEPAERSTITPASCTSSHFISVRLCSLCPISQFSAKPSRCLKTTWSELLSLKHLVLHQTNSFLSLDAQFLMFGW